MKSNLDVWAIQNFKEETRSALANVRKDSCGNILYLNCQCNFKINGKNIECKNFDSCFYSEESDTIIFFEKGKISQREIIEYLEEAEIKYTTIYFQSVDDEIQEDYIPEIWFSREKYVLEDAIDNSIQNGYIECLYDPKSRCTLTIGYNTTFGKYVEIDGRICEGIVAFKDKVILLVSQGDKKNLKQEDVLKILSDKEVKKQIIKDFSFSR